LSTKKDRLATKVELDFVFAYVKGVEREVYKIEREVYKIMNMINNMTDSINKSIDNSKELAEQIKTLNKMLIGYNEKASDDSKSGKYIR